MAQCCKAGPLPGYRMSSFSPAALPVKVATQQGVVVLSGDVPSAEAGDRVVQIVASVSGVKEIKNELKVKAAG